MLYFKESWSSSYLHKESEYAIIILIQVCTDLSALGRLENQNCQHIIPWRRIIYAGHSIKIIFSQFVSESRPSALEYGACSTEAPVVVSLLLRYVINVLGFYITQTGHVVDTQCILELRESHAMTALHVEYYFSKNPWDSHSQKDVRIYIKCFMSLPFSLIDFYIVFSCFSPSSKSH